MSLESGNYIPDLVEAWPDGDADDVNQGDDHIRLIKHILRFVFGSLGAGALTVTAAQINAVIMSAGLASAGTSTTSLTLSSGSKAFATQFNLGFAAGQRIRIASNANVANYMDGVLTAYDKATGAATITIDLVKGSGTFADWSVFFAPPVQNLELIDTVTATGAAFVEWTNFDTLATDYIELHVIGSNLLSDATSRRLTCQLRINNNVQTTLFDGQLLGAASHTQVTGAMSDVSSLTSQANAAMDLRMVFGSLGATAYARARYETVERNNPKLVIGVASSVVTPTTPIQGVRILGSAGTITGAFKLYGVRK